MERRSAYPHRRTEARLLHPHGGAIRDATRRLAERPERHRLLLVLTDDKPNDIDIYEGRYGLEDTRHAIQEARAQDLSPFCVTIDHEAHQYLPLLFGAQGYALVRRPHDLIKHLTQACPPGPLMAPRPRLWWQCRHPRTQWRNQDGTLNRTMAK